MSLFEQLGEILNPNNTEKLNTCKKCKHIQPWDFNGKTFHYCGIRKSNRTGNGLLKVKCKDIACRHFE
jgi:hypothetical protein